MALVRLFLIEQQINPEDLKRHAIEEMTYLAELLPSLYESENEYINWRSYNLDLQVYLEKSKC